MAPKRKLTLAGALYRASFCVDYTESTILRLPEDAKVIALNNYAHPIQEHHKATWLITLGENIINLYRVSDRSTPKKVIINPIKFLPPQYEHAIRQTIKDVA